MVAFIFYRELIKGIVLTPRASGQLSLLVVEHCPVNAHKKATTRRCVQLRPPTARHVEKKKENPGGILMLY
jgi:hypothetical protein